MSVSTTVRPIHRVIGRVRKRLVIMAVAERVVLMSALALIGCVMIVGGVRLGIVPANAWLSIPWVLAGGVTLGILWGLLTRVTHLAAAKRVDDANNLVDRLSNAIAFSTATSPTPFMLAAIDDALRHLPASNPALAAPWFVPRHLWTLLLAAGAFLSLATLNTPLEHQDGIAIGKLTLSPPPSELKAKLLQSETEALDRAIAELDDQLQELLQQQNSEEVQLILTDLKELLEEIRAGQVSPEEAMQRLSEMEKRAEQWQDQEGKKLAEIKEKLREAAEKMKEETAALEQLKNALEEGDLKKAAEALEKMADPKLAQKDKERQMKALEKMAQALKDQKSKTIDELQKEIDRLQKKQEQSRLSNQEKDRLAKKKKELAQLQKEKDQQQTSKAEKQLERLTKALDQAAEEMRREQDEQEANDEEQSALDQAAEELRRMAEGEQQQQTVRRSRKKMGQARDLTRRSSMERGNGKTGEGGESQQGQGEQDSDRLGQKKRRRLDEFISRAQGKQQKMADGSERGKPGGRPGGPNDGKDGSGEQTAMQGDPGSGGGEKTDGEGGGSQPGDNPDTQNPLGEATSLDSKRQDTFVAGHKSKGPSRSETIRAAAGQGFAGTSYRAVYHDYENIVEEDMQREQIPMGHRRYIERYFDLIGPDQGQ